MCKCDSSCANFADAELWLISLPLFKEIFFKWTRAVLFGWFIKSKMYNVW